MIKASMLDFARTGCLGPIHLVIKQVAAVRFLQSSEEPAKSGRAYDGLEFRRPALVQNGKPGFLISLLGWIIADHDLDLSQ